MKFKYASLYLFVFAIFATSFNAFAEKKAEKEKLSNSDKAKNILEKAGKAMKKIKGFSAKTENSAQGHKTVSTIYQRNNPDGTIFLKMEMGGEKGLKNMTFLSNNKGYWYIIGNTAIKMAYMTEMQANAMANMGKIPKLQEDTFYSVEKGKVNDIDCYVITSRISEKQLKNTVDILMKSIPEEMKEMMKKRGKSMDMIAEKIPSVTKNYVSKKDFFVYSTEQYNKNGKKISQMTYIDVKLNIDLDEKLFQVPKDMEVKIAKTMKDYADFMVNAVSNK